MRFKLKFNVKYALIASLLLHCLVLPWKYSGWNIEKTKSSKKIRIVLINKKQKQVVDSQDGGKKIKPVDSRFVGEKNRIFEKQMVAKNKGSFQKAGRGIKSGSYKPQKSQQAKLGKISLADLSLRNRRTLYVPPIGSEKGAKDTMGPARNSDYVEEIPLGDMTNLNTSEFKYYGFFARIKGQLEQYWGLTLREKIQSLHKAGRGPASATRMTSLTITLDKSGTIVNIYIKGTSGVRELDNAAIESFNKAGPFPNPPRGMVKDGRVVFDFGLVSTISG